MGSADRTQPEAWERRLAQLETDGERLRDAVALLRGEWEQDSVSRRQAVHDELETLREAVIRYAVACGAVDVQLAMLRARPADARELSATDSLRRAMEEQNEASDALRTLARTLQQASR